MAPIDKLNRASTRAEPSRAEVSESIPRHHSRQPHHVNGFSGPMQPGPCTYIYDCQNGVKQDG